MDTTDIEPSLRVSNLSKQYTTSSANGVVHALKDVSLSVASGEMLALHGASGSGKSTLLYAMAGLLTVDAGEIHLKGENMTAMTQSERARYRAENIGLVFQDFRLVPYLDVIGNVMLATSGGSDSLKQAMEVITKLGLADRMNHRPSQLSGGEQQRCAMARALVNNPSLILADEPTGNLDAENSTIILDFLKEFSQTDRVVVIATHDPLAVEAAGRRIELTHGTIEG